MATATLSNWFQNNKSTVTSTVAAIAVIVGFQIINPFFLSSAGRVTLVYAMSYFLIAACGLTMVILMGSFDFSIVSVLKLAAMICALYVDRIGLWAIPLALGVSVGLGFINGLLFARFRVPSFLATLGMSLVAEGIALYMSRGFLHVIRNNQFRALSVTFLAGLPSIFYWAIGIWLICIFIAFYTPFGRNIFAIGGNSTAASLSGIHVVKNRISVFMVSGLLAGLAGVLYIAQFGGGSIEMGADMSIPLFASVVAGGTSLAGGLGGPHRTLLGVILITWTQAGMSMLAYGRDMQMVIFAIIAIGMSILTTDKRTVGIVK
jgi:ribose transport system permease protein